MGKIKNIIKKFPKKIMRRFFGIFAVCGLSLAVFSPNVCFAVDSNEETALEKQETFNEQVRSAINMISQIVYIFIWPLLVIAGTALDNTLVYGKFLNLDAALWDIWNIMKNIANFALGFVFIFAVVKNLFKSSFGEGSPMQDAVKVVKGTLISGVLVQMSWFILGTLIDFSTILIYAVGGLPLSMLGSYDAEAASVPIMELHTNLDEKDGDFFYYYSYKGHNFSPCFTIDNGAANADLKLPNRKGRYIAGRKYLYLSGDQNFDTGYCVLYGYPYKYKESPDFFCTEGGGVWCYQKSGTTLAVMNAEYRANLSTFIGHLNTGEIIEQEKNCFIMSAYGTGYRGSGESCFGFGALSFTGDIFSEAQGKMDSLLESSKGRVGPLITMYSSILKVQELLVNPGAASTMSSLFGAIINTFFVVVLFIPIAILAVLLIIRIGYLWVVIAISPILILANFGPDPINKLKDNKILEKFKMKEVFMRIFSPIIVVFAVSLSIIFLTTIRASGPGEDNKQFLDSLGVQQHCDDSFVVDGEGGNVENSPENCRYLVSGLVDLKINLSGFNHGKDVFVRCLMMMLSTGIVRFFMKFAINIMGKGNIGEKLMESSEKLLRSVPIVPLPGGGAIGIEKISEVGLSKRINNITTTMNNTSDDLLRKRFPGIYGITESDEQRTTKQVNAILDEVRTGKKTYNDLKQDQKDVINTYYGNASVAQQVVNNINTYTTNTTMQTTIQNAITQEMQGGTHTSADALRLTYDELKVAVQADPTWKVWASGMIGGAVHTKDGVKIVDIVPGTENRPVYEILDKNKYEERHFGNQTLDVVTQDVYNNNKTEIDKYLKKLSNELQKLSELQAKSQNAQLTQQEQDLLSHLKQLESDLKGKTYTINEIKTALGIQ